MAKTMAKLYSLRRIGIFHGSRFSKSSIPRQGILSKQFGFIEFEKGFDHKLALTGLESMSHIWLIYFFHASSSGAKPLVRPPRAPEKLVGVYATRAPYRPNPIGLTLAKIDKIDDGKLYLSQIDLLDQTPILDIKPYVTQSDLAHEPAQGWIDQIEDWQFTLSVQAQQQTHWLMQNGLPEIFDVLESQLGTTPLQKERKRIQKTSLGIYILSYRTWRLHLEIDEERKISHLLEIRTGYSQAELDLETDPYQDKTIHRLFVAAKV